MFIIIGFLATPILVVGGLKTAEFTFTKLESSLRTATQLGKVAGALEATEAMKAETEREMAKQRADFERKLEAALTANTDQLLAVFGEHCRSCRGEEGPEA